MQCYTQLTPPTAVTHSLSLPFLSPSANNLIIAKTSLLQIFILKSIVTNVSNSARKAHGQNLTADLSAQRGERLHTTKLVLVAQYDLSGTITSIARVKILQSKSGGEALLVSLRDAKLSLIEWDPERYSIATISIHLYERQDLQGSPWEPELGQSVSHLSVDPGSRCAALKFGPRHVAILPFHQAGDDLVMSEFDPEVDGEGLDSSMVPSKHENQANARDKTPYAASFVLSFLILDPTLFHPLHFAFLYEYREPTFGVLSSQLGVSAALLHERRDTLSYTVFTLDLEQRASTTLLSVNGLPNDLFLVVPLPLPVGGALLLGGNEMIHVDQAGKTNGVAINSFAKNSTAFAMLDQADLGLRLEYCIVEQLGLDNRELLIILNNGELAVLTFKIDGRSVSGLSVRRIDRPNGGLAVLAGVSCASVIGRGRMFVGSETVDSMILGWSRKSDKSKRPRSRVNTDTDTYEEALGLDDDDFEDDDDLYSGVKSDEKTLNQSVLPPGGDTRDDYSFRVHDALQNSGPMRDITLTKNIDRKNEGKFSDSEPPRLELIVSSGSGRAGGLTIYQREMNSETADQFKIPNAYAIWSICPKQASDDASAKPVNGDTPNPADNDKYIIASRKAEKTEECSTAYKITSAGLEEIIDADFDSDAGGTIEVGTLNGGTRIVQVLSSELRTYDGDFGLAQIFPMTDDATGAEPKVISASFSDPYVLLIRDDLSVMILRADESGDLDEVERGEAIAENKWLSGSLYEDSNDVLRLESGDDSEDEAGNVLLLLLSSVGGLQIFRLPNLRKPVYCADGLSFLPPFLSTEFTVRRSSARESLKEILLAELGDATHKSPYLILRSVNDELIIYQPYQSPIEGSRDTALRFLKLLNPQFLNSVTDIDYNEESRVQPLRAIPDLDNYSTVFMPGSSPSFIMKPAASPPHIINLRTGPIRSLSKFSTSKCEKGFLYIDNSGSTFSAQLPSDCQYTTGWVTRKVVVGEEIQALDYHEGKDAHVLGTSQLSDFKLPEDDVQGDTNHDDMSFPPQIDQGSIKLLDHKTWSIIDKHGLDPAELIMCIKTMTLEISEHTHARQELVAVGTALVRGEDLSSLGRIYIFAIIDVVPYPGRPETGRKLKLIAKEEVKGAVTALSEIGSQGFLLVAQGQKCLVRGLKEDGSLLPVAFMDMQCYITVAKELKGTGLCLTGDVIKGLWLAGYYEEPYQLRLFGKSPRPIDVVAADFLPDGKQLYIVVADADCNIHILQFDPDDPKSLAGQRLLPLASFHTGHYPSTLTLLPPIPSSPSTSSTRSILLTSSSGSLAILTPLSPPTHRPLAALQAHLQSTLAHPLGLNPRAYRAASYHLGGSGGGGGGGRGGEMGGVVDGGLIRRLGEGGSWKRWDGGGEEGLGGGWGGF